MNTTWRTRSIAALAVALLAGGGAWGVTAAQAADPAPAPAPTTATATADAALVKNLTYMRDEERLARDLYRAFADLYPDVPAFARIANSEQQHFDAIGVLLTRYGLADPSADKAAGVFGDAALQAEYDRLLALGKESLAKAYEAGTEVEEMDIADLDKAIDATTAADAKRVFQNLRNGSEHHLAAFTALAEGKTVGVGAGRGMQGRGMGQGRWANDDDATVTRGRGMGPMDPADCPLR